ncbi:MAG: 2-oxo-4-hydroxy-4-carboxy-5-ureidoimidazoline decarboxylase [Patulibacter sp.]
MAVAEGLDRAAFVARFGDVVEYSPWVAEAAYGEAPFADLAALQAAFAAVLRAAPRERQLEVLRAHPDLAVHERGGQELTAESASEQAGAGLDALPDAERLAFAAELDAYRERFGFPFIACVRDHGGKGLRELLAERIGGEPEAELALALSEVCAIAGHRLADLVE